MIGVTGGIGSGKSTVTRLLHEKYRLPVIDADALAHEVTQEESVAEEIARCIDPSVLDEHGALDRRKLAAVVFNDDNKRCALNAIVHPKVRQLFVQRCNNLAQSGYPCALYDCPLLIEAGLENEMDAVLLVYAAEKNRTARVVARSKLSASEVTQRIASQMKLEEKTDYADYVLYNDGTIDDLHAAVDALYGRFVDDGLIDTKQK
jgi:dephospho-CoA kinase